MDAGAWLAVTGTVMAVLVTILLLLIKTKGSKKSPPLFRSAVGVRNKKKWSHIRIFYGTQTGTAKQFAETLSAELSSSQAVGGDVSVTDLRQCSDPEEMLTQQVRNDVRTYLHAWLSVQQVATSVTQTMELCVRCVGAVRFVYTVSCNFSQRSG